MRDKLVVILMDEEYEKKIRTKDIEYLKQENKRHSKLFARAKYTNKSEAE